MFRIFNMRTNQRSLLHYINLYTLEAACSLVEHHREDVALIFWLEQSPLDIDTGHPGLFWPQQSASEHHPCEPLHLSVLTARQTLLGSLQSDPQASIHQLLISSVHHVDGGDVMTCSLFLHQWPLTSVTRKNESSKPYIMTGCCMWSVQSKQY